MAIVESAASTTSPSPGDGGFRRLYERDMTPILVRMEKRRIVWLIAVIVVPLAFGAAGFGLAYRHLRLETAFYVIATAFSFAVGGIIILLLFRHCGYRGEFKREVVGRVAAFASPALRYYPGDSITKGDVESGNLFGRFNRFSGEDCFVGRIGETAVRFSELRVRLKEGKHESLLFRGVYFIADFNKEFAGRTLVYPDFAESFLGWAGKKMQEWGTSRMGKLVNLEDPEFEREFVVYSTDQVAARYILTPSFMARLVALSRRSDRPFSLAFVRSKMHIAFSSGEDRFEPKLFSTLLCREDYACFYEDIKFFIGIVDDLNLNLRIWSKR